LLSGAWSQAERPPKTATVNIVVVDGLGGKVEGGRIVAFKNQRNGKDFAAYFHLDRFLGKTAEGIPYGHYTVIVSQPGFPDAERPVDISQHNVSVQVCIRTATVHIVDVGPLKRDVPAIHVESFRSREDDLDLAVKFQQGTAIGVPYGTYDLQANKSPTRTLHRRVPVFQSEVWVIFDFELPSVVPEYRAPRGVITGTINVADADRPIFVTLIGVHLDVVIDGKVEMSGGFGTFKLTGFNPEGRYLLVTSAPSGILDIRQIDTSTKEPIMIDLRDKPSPK
jgi:hypothetical protein